MSVILIDNKAGTGYVAVKAETLESVEMVDSVIQFNRKDGGGYKTKYKDPETGDIDTQKQKKDYRDVLNCLSGKKPLLNLSSFALTEPKPKTPNKDASPTEGTG